MNVAIFLQNFRAVANAPGGVQRLRELVLNLAANGKLVSTTETTESALQLIEEIRRVQSEIYGAREYAELKTLPLPIASGSTVFVKLGHIARIISGQHLTPSEYNSKQSGIPYITGPAEFGIRFPVASKWTNERRAVAKSGDILITVKGSGVGKLNFCDVPELAISRQLMAVRPLGDVDIEYVWICLNAAKVHFQSLKTGIAIPGIGRDDVMTLEVRLPPLEEQKRIVAKVDELMRLCDRLEAQQQEREKLLPLLSRANHTRFVAEPTNTNLEAIFHTPGFASPEDLLTTVRNLAMRGRLSSVNTFNSAGDDFPDLIEKSLHPNPHLPSNWLTVRLGDLCVLLGGGTPSKASSEYWNGTIPWVSPKDMKTSLIVDSQDHITDDAIKNSSTRLIPQGSILVVVRGMILIHSFPVAIAGRELTINQDMKALVPHYSGISDYILFALQAFESEIVSKVERSSHGTCKLLTNTLLSIAIPLPPLSEQKRILEIRSELGEKIAKLSSLHKEREELSFLFAKAAVAATTSTNIENSKLKPPKTEIVTALKIASKPQKADMAPLAALLSEQDGVSTAKSLWEFSGLEIDAFYRQLKTEMANGWIEEDKDKLDVHSVEADRQFS